MVTYPRVEIPKKVKLAVFERAGGVGGVCCEGCRLSMRGKKFEYHHVKAEWLQTIPPSAREPITPEDVQLLCVPCHDVITSKDAAPRAKGVRIMKGLAKVDRRYHRKGTPFGFSTRFKRKMNGTVIDLTTGRPVGVREADDGGEHGC